MAAGDWGKSDHTDRRNSDAFVNMAALGKVFGQRDGLCAMGFQVLAGETVSWSYSGLVILLWNSGCLEQQINLAVVVTGCGVVCWALENLFSDIASGAKRDPLRQRELRACIIDLCFALSPLHIIAINSAEPHLQIERPADDGVTGFVIGKPAWVCHHTIMGF